MGAIVIAGLLTMATAGGASALSKRTVFSWGTSPSGQNKVGTPAPLAGDALSTAVQVAEGNFHALAVLKSGTVKAWGFDQFGQLGVGTAESKTTPTPQNVLGINNAMKVAAGNNFSLALLKNGTVIAWGDNRDGELGISKQPVGGAGVSPSLASTPTAVANIISANPAVDIAAGYNHSLAVLADGTVVGWGINRNGQLGEDPTKDPAFTGRLTTPQKVFLKPGEPLKDVVQVAAGGTSSACGGGYQTGGNGFSLALLKNGTVMAWGSDCNGQVGFEGKKARNDVHTPTRVEVKGDTGQLSPLTGVAEVAAGPNFSFALMKTGTVMAWGANAFGELGIGKRAYSEHSKHSNPTAVEAKEPNGKLAPLTGVVAIGAWNGGGFARKSDGTVWAWGSRFDGAVGDGTTGGLTDTAVRVAIPSSMTVNRIGTGCNANYGLAIAIASPGRRHHVNRPQDYLG